jgi:hypothetical protein
MDTLNLILGCAVSNEDGASSSDGEGSIRSTTSSISNQVVIDIYSDDHPWDTRPRVSYRYLPQVWMDMRHMIESILTTGDISP